MTDEQSPAAMRPAEILHSGSQGPFIPLLELISKTYGNFVADNRSTSLAAARLSLLPRHVS